MEQNGTLTALDPHGQPTGIFGRRLDAQSKPGDILDPVAQPSGDLKPIALAPRLAALDGKSGLPRRDGIRGQLRIHAGNAGLVFKKPAEREDHSPPQARHDVYR